MKYILRLLVLGLISFTLAGCGKSGSGEGSGGGGGGSSAAPAKDSHEAAVNDMAGLLEELVTILEGAKDKATAEAAAEKLAGLESKFVKLGERMQALGEPAADKAKELEEKMKEKMQPLMQRMMATMMGLATNQEVQAIIGPAMEKIQGTMASMAPKN